MWAVGLSLGSDLGHGLACYRSTQHSSNPLLMRCRFVRILCPGLLIGAVMPFSASMHMKVAYSGCFGLRSRPFLKGFSSEHIHAKCKGSSGFKLGQEICLVPKLLD